MPKFARAFLFGILFSLAQVAFLMAWAPKEAKEGHGLAATYSRLTNWDGSRYVDIAANGYRADGCDSPAGCHSITSDDIHQNRANAVFFPGFPFFARAVSQLFGVSAQIGVILGSQICTVFVWTYILLLLWRFGASEKRALTVASLIAIHPASYFMAAGYTESLFLASMLGYLYWSYSFAEKPRTSAWLLAALHGSAMSLTRIVSIALAPFPLIVAWRGREQENRGRYLAAAGLGAFAIIGAILFFAWCHYRFGMWNLYFLLEEVGWGNIRDWFAIINPMSYVPRFFFEHTVESFNRMAMPFTAWLAWLAYRRERGARVPMQRIGLYFIAFFLYYIPLTGKANAKMDSMIRYTFPTYILLLLALAQHADWSMLKRRRGAVAAGLIFMLAMQCWFAFRFLRGFWVA